MDEIFTGGAIAAIISIINLLVITATAILLYHQIKTNNDWNRRKTAHDLILDSNMGAFRTLRNKLENKIDIYDQVQTYATIKTSLDKEDRMTLDAILNYLDNFCLTVKNKVVDQNISFDCMAAIVVAYNRWASPYIQECREINPLFWIEIDPLVEEWSKRMEEIKISSVKKGRTLLSR